MIRIKLALTLIVQLFLILFRKSFATNISNLNESPVEQMFVQFEILQIFLMKTIYWEISCVKKSVFQYGELHCL